MRLADLQPFMTLCGFPKEGCDALSGYAKTLYTAFSADFDALLQAYAASDYSYDETDPKVTALAERSGIHPYSIWMLVLCLTAMRVREDLAKLRITGDVFYDTFTDLSYKLLECKEVYGVWGTFVASWYGRFFKGKLVKLGRLEYEYASYTQETPFCLGNTVISPGDMVLSIHIPSHAGPFTAADRLDSYKKAFHFFKDDFSGGIIKCICSSWLLYPGYRDILPPNSNILDFAQDLHILSQTDIETLTDAWRVFGAHKDLPVSDLPEHTSMQRAFKARMGADGLFGYGFGVLIFDGERLLTRREEFCK